MYHYWGKSFEYLQGYYGLKVSTIISFYLWVSHILILKKKKMKCKDIELLFLKKKLYTIIDK